LGQQDANLRTATAGTPFRLFTTTSRMSAAPMLDLRAGIALTRRYGVEGHASYGHPEVRTSISSDAEGAPDVTAVERLDEYLIDAGVVVRFDLGARPQPRQQVRTRPAEPILRCARWRRSRRAWAAEMNRK